MEQIKVCGVQLKQSTNIEYNFKKHVYYIKNEDCDLLIFPECSLVGYSLERIKTYKENLSKYKNLETFHNKLIKLIRKTNKTVIFGSVLYNEKKRKFYNCAFIVNKYKISIYKKISLTEDENKLFSKGKSLLSFRIKNKTIIPIVCRDQSNIKLFEDIKKREPNLVIILSAHYYNPKEIFWKKTKNIAITIVRSIDYGVNILKVNSVGILGKKLSHGNSIFTDNYGKIKKILNEFDEDVIRITL